VDWVIAVPLKSQGSRKTRLSSRLSEAERDRLTELMFRRVLDVLAGIPDVTALPVCEERPRGWHGAWHRDSGGGLNAALSSAREACRDINFAVIHADLPYLEAADVEALLTAAHAGCAIAPDRGTVGTNGVAMVQGVTPNFVFGPESFVRFTAQDGLPKAIVTRPGLANDLDTPEDYDAWLATSPPSSRIVRNRIKARCGSIRTAPGLPAVTSADHRRISDN